MLRVRWIIALVDLRPGPASVAGSGRDPVLIPSTAADLPAPDLRRVAFGDTPEAPFVVGPDDPPERRWLAAVILGGRARYGAAWALLEPIVNCPSAPAAVRAHAAITRASHLRQLGGHLPARRWDGLGLASACSVLEDRTLVHRGPEATTGERGPGWDVCGGPGLDAAAARIDALLGLAADALGLGEFALSDRLLQRAEPLALIHPSWRPTVRLHWIRAELALSVDRPDVALERAELAAALSREAGAARHEVKSLLVRVVARSCVGEGPPELYRSLEDLTERAIGTRLNSLEWPIRLLLGQMGGSWDGGNTPGHRARYRRLLASIRRACDPIGRMVLDRSPWVAGAFGP